MENWNERLLSFIVGNACVIQVDGNAFRGKGLSSACLSQTEDSVRAFGADRLEEDLGGPAKDDRQAAFDDFCSEDLIRDIAEGFLCGIQFIPAEGFERSDQDLHKTFSISIVTQK